MIYIIFYFVVFIHTWRVGRLIGADHSFWLGFAWPIVFVLDLFIDLVDFIHEWTA